MSPELTIQELLERGLHYYGLGEIKKALELWNKVLERDSANETAREYIAIETGHQADEDPEPQEALDPQPEVDEEPESTTAISPKFIEGQQFLQVGQWQKASRTFEATHNSDPENPLSWAYVELSRALLIKETIDKIGGFSTILELKIPLIELIGQKDFTQEEGFVLSLISGDISLEDVIALSPIPRFLTYNLLNRLLLEDLLKTGGNI